MIQFSNPRYVALWNNEIAPQLSDGAFENDDVEWDWFYDDAVAGDVDIIDVHADRNFRLTKLVVMCYEWSFLLHRAIAYYNAGDMINRKFNYDVRIPVDKIFHLMYDLINQENMTYQQAIKYVIDNADETVEAFFNDVDLPREKIVMTIFVENNVDDEYNKMIIRDAIWAINGILDSFGY